MPDATFACPDLTTFCRLGELGLGLGVVGQRLQADRAVLACRVVDPDRWCDRCGCEGVPRDSVTLRVTGQLRHIGIGRTHARTHVTLLVHDLHVTVVNAATGEVLRDLTIDPRRDYQPTGRPKT